jgi:hypothetical protein
MLNMHRITTGATTLLLTAVIGIQCVTTSLAAEEAAVIRSVQSGPWSDPATWAGGKLPPAGAKVQIRQGHTVVYDIKAEQAIRSVHIAGTLRFDPDRDTRLDVGLIRIQAGDSTDEEGFDCNAHLAHADPGQPRPALEVGSPNQPISAKHTALIRLVYFKGMNKESYPAIVCCGGRMDFHGAPLSRTWVKLNAAARNEITMTEAVTGWRVGDRVIVTATQRDKGPGRGGESESRLGTLRPGSSNRQAFTEERTIKAIDGAKLTLDNALAHEHQGGGEFSGEVANLSRNVVVESADPSGVRGHTMYHRGSAGAISYAEFRHLGKEGVLGRYPIHYHLVGATMRGSSVIGASIWDSHNRWLTIHGTNYLVVRDCVGYQSAGHGFYLEDGTEVYNVLDRNLAVQAYQAKPLPEQVLPFDKNDGAGFWWANSLNTFTRNVSCENDRYGYRFEATPTRGFDLRLAVQQPDGSRKKVDIRSLPFVRFEANEAHSQLYGLNLGEGEGVDRIAPDERHPFVVRNTKIWNVEWAFRPESPSVLVDQMRISQAAYGIYKPGRNRIVYRQLSTTGQNDGVPEAREARDEAFARAFASLVDDLPPATVITHVGKADAGKLVVRGVSSDNGTIKRVLVNGQEARPRVANFAEWEVVLEGVRPGELKLTAHAEDQAGNVEQTKHVLTFVVK